VSWKTHCDGRAFFTKRPVWSVQQPTAAFSESAGNKKGAYYFDIAEDRVRAGDLAGAKATAAKIREPDWVYRELAEAQAKAGDVAGAIDYSDHLPDNQFARCHRLVEAAKLLCPAPKEPEDDRK
jgi:hypothetical protein